jgi:hypothetical protein
MLVMLEVIIVEQVQEYIPLRQFGEDAVIQQGRGSPN